jgi:hypothetical protein
MIAAFLAADLRFVGRAMAVTVLTVAGGRGTVTLGLDRVYPL